MPALRVSQWLKAWDRVSYDEAEHRSKPEPYFYIFSLGAHELRRLSGIRRRDASEGQARSEDLGIQRRHDPVRSDQIAEYVRHGFPWSDLNKRQRATGKFDDLKKPGWLPTSVVINVLTADDERDGTKVAENDLIKVIPGEGKVAEIELPRGFSPTWQPSGSEPVEIIDGQHRLWAFEHQLEQDDFELPVVAFVGLDVSWQAYLFWTINIKPKRINASLAFDLYPLLRTENWLNRFQGIAVYRETRAQELTEALWALPESPWHDRINMLGESGRGGVSQAAWIRSLVATYIRPSEGRAVKLGGLFGAPIGEDELALPWTRAQQAAFLIYLWQQLANEIHKSDAAWAQSLRGDVGGQQLAHQDEDEIEQRVATGHWDPAFAGRYSLLNTDQGVRAFLHVTNDIFVVRADQLRLRAWSDSNVEGSVSQEATEEALTSLAKQPFVSFIADVAVRLSEFDWRTSSAPDLEERERTLRVGFRGTGGYREFRRALLRHLEGEPEPFPELAGEILDTLGLRD